MGKEGKASKVILSTLILLAVVHLTTHILVYGAIIPGIPKYGISGLAVGKVMIFDEIQQKFPGISTASLIIIAGEWLFVFVIILVILIKGEISLKKDLSNVERAVKTNKGEQGTDLDTLYDMLKEKKTLRLRTIAKLFGVNKNVAMNWCRILEEGNLATIHYPTVGDAKIMIQDESEKEK